MVMEVIRDGGKCYGVGEGRLTESGRKASCVRPFDRLRAGSGHGQCHRFEACDDVHGPILAQEFAEGRGLVGNTARCGLVGWDEVAGIEIGSSSVEESV